MKRQFELGLALALSLAVPSLSFAQRGVRVTPPQSVARARVPSSTSVVARAGNHATGSRAARASSLRAANEGLGFIGGPPLSIQELLNPFPGFGFNFQSPLLNQDLGIKALIDPATQARLALAERLRRETQFAPGFFLIDGGGSYAVPVAADQDQGAQAQQPMLSQQDQTVSEETYEPPPTETAAPLPDEGEFTLVLRNGKQFQAAAFTRMNDKIIYITPDGGRRSVAVADLDTNATLRINQERGTPLQLPL
jgi:hypothetical protein